MVQQFPRIPLLAYADRLSARPGETVAFKVSSDGPEPFTIRLTRSISADPNPAGQGIVEEPVEAEFAESYPSRRQSFNPGSYLLVERGPRLGPVRDFRPYLAYSARDREQAILSMGGLELCI